MEKSSAGLSEPFEEDDYEEVNAAYFSDIFAQRSWAALPAGAYNPSSDGAALFKPLLPPSELLQKYAVDEGRALGAEKEALLKLVGAWEENEIGWDTLTVCPSVSAASLVVLKALRSQGVATVIFESPAYFASVEQARMLGFHVVRVPSWPTTNFERPLGAFVEAARDHGRCAAWLTQPRFAIGTNQDVSQVRALAEALPKESILVIDEAAEQKFPSHFRNEDLGPLDVIRMRGLLKGVGLNGLRVSIILHPDQWRDPIERSLETSGASIDRFSLHNAAALSEVPDLLKQMLGAASAQVVRYRRKAESTCSGTWATPTPLVNGYIGCLLLDLSGLPGALPERRTALLEHFRSIRLPVVLRASIGFPCGPDWEAIRLNYFTPETNVLTAVTLVAEAFEPVRDRLGVAYR